jgi:hypothetical protein
MAVPLAGIPWPVGKIEHARTRVKTGIGSRQALAIAVLVAETPAPVTVDQELATRVRIVVEAGVGTVSEIAVFPTGVAEDHVAPARLEAAAPEVVHGPAVRADHPAWAAGLGVLPGVAAAGVVGE